jgi:hypothetical protein
MVWNNPKSLFKFCLFQHIHSTAFSSVNSEKKCIFSYSTVRWLNWEKQQCILLFKSYMFIGSHRLICSCLYITKLYIMKNNMNGKQNVVSDNDSDSRWCLSAPDRSCRWHWRSELVDVILCCMTMTTTIFVCWYKLSTCIILLQRACLCTHLARCTLIKIGCHQNRTTEKTILTILPIVWLSW